MQSSRASDRSDREHLKNQNKHRPEMRKEKDTTVSAQIVNEVDNNVTGLEKAINT